jgi:hypothetical protein
MYFIRREILKFGGGLQTFLITHPYMSKIIITQGNTPIYYFINCIYVDYIYIYIYTYVELTTLTPWRQNPRVHHRIHKNPPPVPILSQLDPLHTPPANFAKIHSDPILPSTPWYSKWSLSFGLSQQNPVHFPLPLPRAPPPIHSPWYDLPNDI